MDFVNVQWHGQAPVSVTTPYNHVGNTWAPTSWVRDAEVQTLSLHEIVRETLANMVIDALSSKGLPLMACTHTKGLQLENIISGIVDNHTVMCMHASQQLQDSYGNWTGSIPLQDVDNDDDLETQRASNIVAQLTAFGTAAYNPSIVTEGKSGIALQYSENGSLGKQSLKKGSPVTPDKTSGDSPKRCKAPPGTVYKCQKCDKVFNLNKDLVRHEARHSLDRPYKCDKCDYSAKTQHQRSKHIRMIHHNKYPHYCGTCGKGCHSLQSKVEHEHCHLKSEDKPFKCLYCNKGHPSQRRLDLHVRLHEDDKKIKCEMCELKFVTSNGYKSHLKLVHKALTGVNSNKCLICSLEMIERHLLIDHMKANHGDVGDKCEDCGMKFSNFSKLEAHLNRYHRKLPTADKPSEINFSLGGEERSFHMCKLCGGLFADVATLSQHMPIHRESKALTNDVILRITNAQRQIAEYRARGQTESSQLDIMAKPKAKLGRPPNFSSETKLPLKPGILKNQIGEFKTIPNRFAKSNNLPTAVKTQEIIAENTILSGESVMLPAENQNMQSQLFVKPDTTFSSNNNSKEAFIIYTKSPAKVADMLLKGQLKLSLKVPVSGSGDLPSPSKDTYIHDTEATSSSQEAIISNKNKQILPIYKSGAPTASSSTVVLPIPPVQLIVTTTAVSKASSLTSTTSQSESKQTLDASLTAKQTKPEKEPAQQQLIGERVKDLQNALHVIGAEGVHVQSTCQEPLIICTSSPDKMMEMLKKGEMKVVISSQNPDDEMSLK